MRRIKKKSKNRSGNNVIKCCIYLNDVMLKKHNDVFGWVYNLTFAHVDDQQKAGNGEDDARYTAESEWPREVVFHFRAIDDDA